MQPTHMQPARMQPTHMQPMHVQSTDTHTPVYMQPTQIEPYHMQLMLLLGAKEGGTPSASIQCLSSRNHPHPFTT